MTGREATVRAKVSREFVVVLHNIRSLHNVGSLFRTADGAGVGKIYPHTKRGELQCIREAATPRYGVGVYLCGITPAPLDGFGKIRPQLAKVSLGAERFVKWDASARSTRATLKLLEKLKKDGYKVFAVEQAKNSIPYYRVKLRGSRVKKVALVLGGEVKGLPPSILRHADKILEIPMRGKKESLNVSVAFGIVAYHLIF